jgi:hypothetical protein
MTLSFAPDRIEMWPLARLQPYAKNAKVHGADQVAKIAASMAEFGWTVPCLVAEGGRQVRAELEGIGEAGSRGFGRLSSEMELANGHCQRNFA